MPRNVIPSFIRLRHDNRDLPCHRLLSAWPGWTQQSLPPLASI
ncbi:hypothetical protein BSIN_0005 [Burkholderia singularis]|uniref:Uncharacterized protein n=1 Tax=Burkholderia singularis TaxID=1503053 RepID=A0A238H209_9BURK|nr:hypothetical protein BSIN_0005 [Burkholderia singularis]